MAAVIEHFVIALLLSILIYTNKESIRKYWHTREEDALVGLQETISNSTPNFTKVAVGVNSNIDLIAPVFKVFDKLNIKAGKERSNCKEINTLAELESCFSFSFEKCAAAERFVANKKIFDQIVNAVQAVTETKSVVGGNAALMGLKMLYTYSDSKILLGGPVGSELRNLLDDRIEVPSLQTADQYHIILEYKTGETWGSHASSCANRFIITHDIANGRMSAMEMFFGSLPSFNPDLVVISGLHLLESETLEVISKRVAALCTHLKQISRSTPVHLELASMVHSAFVARIAKDVFPLVDSIGLNEQELGFFSKSFNGPHSGGDDLNHWPPEIAVMSDVLHWMMVKFGRQQNPASRLSRIHFHSLTYHIIAVLPPYWSNSQAASAAGSRATTRQACDSEDIHIDEVELRIPRFFARSVNYQPLRHNLMKYDQANPITSWTRDGIEFDFTAVLVCKKPVRTVGLGDCISATGLQYSKFNKFIH